MANLYFIQLFRNFPKETIVDKIKFKISEVKRELTEDEKNEIIEKCLKQNFITNK